MKRIMTIITFILAFGFSNQSSAGLLTISVDETDVDIGESVLVTLAGTGFAPFDGFDLLVSYDTDVFGYMPGTLNSNLGLFGMVENEVNGSGLAISYVNLFGINSGEFNASFSLSALTAGISGLSLESELFVLSDPFTQQPIQILDVNFENGPGLLVTDVPEPNISVLMMLAGCLMFRRKKTL